MINTKIRDYAIVACLSVGLSLLGVFLLRMDFGRSDFSSGDLVLLFSWPTWIYLFCLPLGLLLVNKLGNKRLSWIIPITMVIILMVIFPLMQRPSVFFWDSFRHSTLPKHIETYGYFANYTGYFQYPGTFVLSAMVSETLGMEVLEANMLLGSVLNVLIVCLLLIVGKLLIGSEKCWLVPTIYMAFSFRLFNGYHYSPQLIGLCLYVLFVFASIKSLHRRDRLMTVLMLVSTIALTITHVFSIAMVLCSVACIYIFGGGISFLKLKNKQFVTSVLLLVTIVLFVSWQSYVAVQTLGDVVSFLSSVVRGERAFSGFREVIVYNPSPGALVPLLGFYRYGIYGAFAILSILGIILMRRTAEARLIILLTVGVLFGGILIYLTPAEYGVGRILFFGGVIVSVLSAIAAARSKGIRWVKRISWLFEGALPFLVIGTFLVSNLYYSTYVSFMHPDEVRACEFSVMWSTKPITSIIDDVLVLQYFAEDYSRIRIVDDKLPADMAVKRLASASISLQYLPRLQYYYDIWFVEDRSDLVYSNDQCRIYVQASANLQNP